jgi:hypothetical protein
VTCGEKFISFDGATTSRVVLSHGHPGVPCITLTPRPGGNLLYDFIMQVDEVNDSYFQASASCLVTSVTGDWEALRRPLRGSEKVRVRHAGPTRSAQAS